MKLEPPHLVIFVQHGIYQKYKFTVEKTSYPKQNDNKTNHYKILSIEGIENDSELFKHISEIIVTELKN